jgi:hypothetical protein
MSSTTYSPYSSRYQAVTGLGYDGVVRIRVGDYYATGVLLSDGRSLLTAAHLYTNVVNAVADTEIFFETITQNKTSSLAQSVTVHPDYSSVTTGADLAIVRLNNSAFIDAQRYSIYRNDNIENQLFTMVGYGKAGTGSDGSEASSSTPTRRMADNTIDGDIDLLNYYLGSTLAWHAPEGTQFIADFDNGSYTNDAVGRLLNTAHIGVGSQEGLIASGDSGGPAFIDDKIAGIASYTASLSNGSVHPDIDSVNNSSYGEIAAWQKLSYYQEWIDEQQRAHYENAPTKAQDVKKEVDENDSGTAYAYFLLEFTGLRSYQSQILSVDYTTRDGTARADEDYIAISDTLILYPDQTQAVIAVEIIGDSYAEADEIFYLDLTNPIGGSFGDGAVMLSAMRTILNDDFIA